MNYSIIYEIASFWAYAVLHVPLDLSASLLQKKRILDKLKKKIICYTYSSTIWDKLCLIHLGLVIAVYAHL